MVVGNVDELVAALRSRRQALGLPLTAVGARAQMPYQMVHTIEAGRQQPGAVVLLRLLDALDCDLVFAPRLGRRPGASRAVR